MESCRSSIKKKKKKKDHLEKDLWLRVTIRLALMGTEENPPSILNRENARPLLAGPLPAGTLPVILVLAPPLPFT